MSKQTLEYLKEMEEMYLIIMKKCVNEDNLTDMDRLFLETYKRTIEKGA